MINYKKNKKIYKVNDLGSLYIDESKIKVNEQPIIYIGGQMGPKGHVKESKSGYTKDKNHNNYTGSWMYDYSLNTANKMEVNGENFANSLIADITLANLSDVVLLTGSYGGIIGAYATKSDRISKVIAVHPPILGTPIANPKYLKSLNIYYTKLQKLLLKYICMTNPYIFGFEYDNFNGLDINKVNLNKLLVIGNSVKLNLEKNPIVLELYDIIKKATGKENDGVIVFEPKEFEQKGINYFISENYNNHFSYSKLDNMKKILSIHM